MYIHIRQMQPEVQCIMFFLCASSQRHVAKHRSTKPSHPAGLTSFGWWLLRSKLNNQIELDLPLCDKNHPKSSKKNPRFFFRIHRCIFSYLLQNDHWNPSIDVPPNVSIYLDAPHFSSAPLKPSTTRLDDMAVSRFSMFGRNTMVTNSEIDVHFAVSDTIFAISFCWRHHPNGEVTQFLGSFWIPSGKLLHNYGKSPCSMGKSTINGDFQ